MATASVDVRRTEDGWTATVRTDAATEHTVHVATEDLVTYGATDPADLVKRSFDFLLEREPASSILREFRITEIEKYFPEYAAAIKTA